MNSSDEGKTTGQWIADRYERMRREYFQGVKSKGLEIFLAGGMSCWMRVWKDAVDVKAAVSPGSGEALSEYERTSVGCYCEPGRKEMIGIITEMAISTMKEAF